MQTLTDKNNDGNVFRLTLTQPQLHNPPVCSTTAFACPLLFHLFYCELLVTKVTKCKKVPSHHLPGVIKSQLLRRPGWGKCNTQGQEGRIAKLHTFVCGRIMASPEHAERVGIFLRGLFHWGKFHGGGGGGSHTANPNAQSQLVRRNGVKKIKTSNAWMLATTGSPVICSTTSRASVQEMEGAHRWRVHTARPTSLYVGRGKFRHPAQRQRFPTPPNPSSPPNPTPPAVYHHEPQQGMRQTTHCRL